MKIAVSTKGQIGIPAELVSKTRSSPARSSR